MKTARALMEPAVTVGPDATVRAIADLLLGRGDEGVCVVEGQRLIGVVTTMDLVFKEKKVHLPTFFTILDAIIPMGSMRDVEEELQKIAASTARELMSEDVITVSPDDTMDTLATRMVEEHLTMLPVVEGGVLLGVVSKRSLLRGSGLGS